MDQLGMMQSNGLSNHELMMDRRNYEQFLTRK
ncbi:Uncharacterised protein [Mycobacteroides abscessus subsp. abscessus]|nr:Uncharacterised protein [Mycobacteroides abscessus subsp. abscessus]